LPPERRWLAVVVVAVGTVMAVLDGSIANTALPTIARELHTSAAQSIWVVNGFQLAVTMTILTYASLGDSRGVSFVYRLGIVVFTIGSLACALSRSLPLLIASRVLQGVGAAALMAVGPALYRQIFPPRELGKALGISAVIVATSAAAGPTIGGSLLAIAPWPWLFAVNVPLGIFDAVYSVRMLPNQGGTGKSLDPASMVLSALGFGSLIFGIDGFARHDALAVIGLEIGFGIGCGVAFVRRQLGLRTPMLAVDLFAKPTFALASVTSALTYIAQGLAFVSLPFFFQTVLGRTPFESGLLLTSWPLSVALAAPVAGRLSDRYPAGILSTIGLTIMTAGLALYAALPQQPTIVEIVVRGLICGIGFGFFQAPNNRELIGSAPRSKTGSAAGVLASMRLTGQTTGAALVAIVFGTVGAAVAAGGEHVETVVLIATPVTLWIACASAGCGAIASGFRLLTLRGSGRAEFEQDQPVPDITTVFEPPQTPAARRE
jgi:DHA2 family multidrug resistance protein-like MFS transporter